ncbi:MAG: hypothetical protein K2H14_09825, partial [Muribaculaceae bacterium]|nr:hypothetical protein [Muribaculaceae bacterium]
MKNRNLYITALMATIFSGSATAGSSPFTGSEAGEGIFYLYNADTGLWLQNNDRRTDHFTTRAELDTRGFDVEISAEGDGYRLNPRFGGNHSINGGENLYMDTGDAVTIWQLNRAADSDVPNAYRIESESGSLGMGDNGFLTGCATGNNIWQLVSRQERIEAMAAGAINNPVDVTWLVQDPNFGFNDERYAAWNARFEGGNNPVAGDDKVRCNRAHESWNSASIEMRQTITDIPNGIYRVSVQGFYRDSDGVNRYENGTEVLRTRYFANEQSLPLMSTFAGGADQADDNHDLHAGGKWAPNSLGNASLAFFNGEYKNEPLVVEVTDGTLTIG